MTYTFFSTRNENDRSEKDAYKKMSERKDIDKCLMETSTPSPQNPHIITHTMKNLLNIALSIITLPFRVVFGIAKSIFALALGLALFGLFYAAFYAGLFWIITL